MKFSILFVLCLLIFSCDSGKKSSPALVPPPSADDDGTDSGDGDTTGTGTIDAAKTYRKNIGTSCGKIAVALEEKDQSEFFENLAGTWVSKNCQDQRRAHTLIVDKDENQTDMIFAKWSSCENGRLEAGEANQHTPITNPRGLIEWEKMNVAVSSGRMVNDLPTYVILWYAEAASNSNQSGTVSECFSMGIQISNDGSQIGTTAVTRYSTELSELETIPTEEDYFSNRELFSDDSFSVYDFESESTKLK